MSDRLLIIGAGMAGLLAANMLRKYNPMVLEASNSLPNNHSAVLRFRTNAVADVLGIPFKKVNLIKTTLDWHNPVADSLSYSFKNMGVYESDRSLTRGVSSNERWIAPENLIEMMAEGVSIRYGIKYDFKEGRQKVLSTIPMPQLMSATDYPRRDNVNFRYSSGVNITARIEDCDAYATVNVPDPNLAFSRVSLTGNKLIVEFPRCHLSELGDDFSVNDHVTAACVILGIDPDASDEVEVHEQKYQKIAAIDEGERKTFIHWASATKQVAWQLGRFATWRPGLLLDDLIKDVRLIERWMNMPASGYEMEMNRGRG